MRDDFELKVLPELPQSHEEAAKLDAAWLKELKQWTANPERGPAPVPPCPACPDDPWVVIARIRLPAQATAPISAGNINYVGRRVLYSVQSLHTLVLSTI